MDCHLASQFQNMNALDALLTLALLNLLDLQFKCRGTNQNMSIRLQLQCYVPIEYDINPNANAQIDMCTNKTT